MLYLLLIIHHINWFAGRSNESCVRDSSPAELHKIQRFDYQDLSFNEQLNYEEFENDCRYQNIDRSWQVNARDRSLNHQMY